MRKYTKLSALAAAFLITSFPLQADNESIPSIQEVLNTPNNTAVQNSAREDIVIDQTNAALPATQTIADDSTQSVQQNISAASQNLQNVTLNAKQAAQTAAENGSSEAAQSVEAANSAITDANAISMQTEEDMAAANGMVSESMPDTAILNAPQASSITDNVTASGANVEVAQEIESWNENVQPSTTKTVFAPSYEGVYAIELPDNGLIYASQDPTIGEIILNVSSIPYVSFSNGVIEEPVSFYIRSNYSSFMERMEILIYRAADTDMIEPLVTIPVEPTPFGTITWDGKLPDKYTYSAGDELTYVLKAYDKDGNFDETTRSMIELLKPEDVRSNQNTLKDFVSKEQGVQLDASQATSQYLLDETFSSNALYRQNIVVHGTKVVIRGSNIPESTQVYINDSVYPVDFERRFIAEYIVPEGEHYYDVSLQGKINISDRLKVEVSPHYFFGVAIADFTLRQSDYDAGTSQGTSDEDLLKDGRLAFYLKGKAYSKYQITAQADTTQKDIKKLFNGFTQAEPVDLFESLDPDMYYPTYGDDSSTFRDVNTQGRFYVRADWDKSHALWGNYNTEFDGTQYASYSRSLYGAKLDYRTISTNEWGDAVTNLKLFGSEAQSAGRRNEFLGTGGSLYYLRNTDIVPGSEKVLLQVTDRVTGNILGRVDLMRGADYEIDNIQGRIILNRPLSQIIYQNLKSITSTTPVSGYEQRLIVDYEFVPSAFEEDMLTAGIRGKQWLGDHVALGGTYIREEKGGEDYEIMGGDITLQAGKGTYLKAEMTRTKSDAAPIFYSDNGGFNFVSLGTNSNGTAEGDAIAVDGRVNLKELGLTESNTVFGAWWRDVEDGFSSTASSLSYNGIKEYGAEMVSEIGKNINLYAKFSKAERSDNASYTEAQVTSEYRFSDSFSLSAEVLNVKSEQTGAEDQSGTLGALRIDYDITPSLETYLTGQLTLEDNGNYENNDAVIVGTRYLYGDSSIGGQYTFGHRGEAASVDISHQLNPDHTIYGGYTWSDEYSSDFNNAFGSATSGLTLGQRWNITNKITLFNESQYLRNQGDKGSTDTLGMDFYLGEGWSLGFTYQKGELDAASGGDVDRDAFSVSAGKTSSVMNWLSKFEYRKDTGAEDREQWVTTNRLTYKVNESLRLAGRLNYSETDDKLNAANGARFAEANFGFAYRPFNSDTWAVFGRYTYLYDLATLGQEIVNGSAYDQKSQVISLEGVYKANEKWEFAAKYATRMGEARYGRGVGAWFDSRTSFYAGQIRYDLFRDWHALAEYRVLDVKDGGIKQGYMVGLDKDLTENFRIGVGYNFTNFSDDLTQLDYKYKGWFVNVVGTY